MALSGRMQSAEDKGEVASLGLEPALLERGLAFETTFHATDRRALDDRQLDGFAIRIGECRDFAFGGHGKVPREKGIERRDIKEGEKCKGL